MNRMNRKLVLIFFTSLSFVTQLCVANNSIPEKHIPATVVIAWDFHDVLVQKNWWAMFQRMADILKKSESSWNLIKIIPSILYDTYQLTGVCSYYEKLIDTFIKKYPQLAPHRKEFLLLINQHTPIEESVQILQQLNKLGYRNFLASNMGKDSFDLINKKYPAIFNQFDGHYIPHTQKDTGNDFLIGKPCVEYFQEFREYLKANGIDENTAIIFIDNNQQNVASANNNNLNITGILFTSPEQLKTELASRIIMKKEKENE